MRFFSHLVNIEISQDVRTRMLHGVIGFVIFLAIGYYAPRIYINNFDKTDYITITQPIPLDKDIYRHCDNITLLANINSKINVRAKVSIQLIEASDKSLKPLMSSEGTYLFVEGKNLESAEIPLKEFEKNCDRKPGIYFFRGIITYKYKDDERTYSYITTTFKLLPTNYPATEEEIILKDIEENKEEGE